VIHDVAVIGLGAMGSAASYQLARRGQRVIGFDRYEPPHNYGSHCGESRITRIAIGEGEQYVPLVTRSHEIWRELEEASGETLLEIRGGLWISSERRGSEVHVADFFAKTVAAARRFGIAHEVLDAQQIRRRFPIFQVKDDEHGYFEPGAGLVRPEACVRTQLTLAARHVRSCTSANAWSESPSAGAMSRSRPSEANTWRSKRSFPRVLCTRPASPGVTRLLTVTRQTQYWFEAMGHEELPVWIWELQERKHGIYGFPPTPASRRSPPKVFAGEITPEYMFESLVAPHVGGIERGR
jgi:sarcosine oxidase